MTRARRWAVSVATSAVLTLAGVALYRTSPTWGAICAGLCWAVAINTLWFTATRPRPVEVLPAEPKAADSLPDYSFGCGTCGACDPDPITEQPRRTGDGTNDETRS